MTEQHEITKLLSEKTGEVVAFACKECRKIISTNSTHVSLEEAEKYAMNHANPPPCEVCGSSLNSWAGYISPCSVCSRRRISEECQQKEEQKFAAAKKLPMSEWSGECLSDGDENYFFSLDEALDYYDRRDVARPSYLWDCDPEPMSMDADGIIEHALSDHHEDAVSKISFSETKRLQKYLDRWCKEQKIKSWYPNYEMAILIDPSPEFNEVDRSLCTEVGARK